MTNHAHSSTFMSPDDLAARCPSPTKGVHKCVFCNKTTARVSGDAWKRLHPQQGVVPCSLLPQDHPHRRRGNFGWRLFSWFCASCMHNWYSYKYYLSCDEVPASNSDYLPQDPTTLKELPSRPRSDAPTPETNGLPFGKEAVDFVSIPFPARSSSLAVSQWSTAPPVKSSFQNLPLEFPLQQSSSISVYPTAQTSTTAEMASAMATAEYVANMDMANFDRVWAYSMPEFSDAQMTMLANMSDQRHTLPFPEKKHNRGENFDHPNFVLIRKRGACLTCKEKKRKCDPSHVHFDVSGNSSPKAK